MLEAILKRGTMVTVVMTMIMLLGILAAMRVPIQMIPDLDVRVVSIETSWPGATPQDIEKEIIIEQEEYLRSLPNLKRMISEASTGYAVVELEFPFGTDVTEMLIRVNNALSQVPSYPENVDEPVLYTNSFSENSFMSFRVIPLPGNPKGLDMNMMRDFIDDNARTPLERVPGVSQVEVGGGAERQIQIIVDHARLAERGISLTQLREAIRSRNMDMSAGDVDDGKRRYLLRTVGRFESLEALEHLIITRRGDSITRLSDVAEVKLHHFEIRSKSYTNGESNVRLSLRRQIGSNVIAIKESVFPVVEQINRDILEPNGMHMTLSNDDVRYVEASVKNVWQNLAIGAALAILVLLIFLRSISATFIGICGIPVCTVASFIGLLAMGRTINVISLAGVAFAIGMAVDNTIVVLESIQQERQKGRSRFDAALHGVRNVWTAVMASTLTTVLVFIPLLFVKEEAGQLFSDIGIAIAASIIVSMVVSFTVVPVACAYLPERKNKFADKAFAPAEGKWLKMVIWIVQTPLRQVACIVITLMATVGGLYFLTPPAEYLPEGEEAKSFSTMIAPPGYSLKEMEKIAMVLQDDLLRYLDQNPDLYDQGKSEVPALSRFSVIMSSASLLVIAETVNPGHIDAFMEILNERFRTYPGMRAFSSRGSIISSNDGGTRAVNLDISGPDLPAIYSTAQLAFNRAEEVLENPQVNSVPSSLTLGQPLLQIKPNWERLAELNITPQEFGYAVAALTDGAFVDEFFLMDDKVDMFLYSQAISAQKLDNIEGLSIYTPQGTVLPVSALAEITETVDTANIRRVNGRRTVTLHIIPPRSVALETAVITVRNDVVAYIRNSGSLPTGVNIDISGASDQLEATRKALGDNIWVALVLCYLQLVIIYKHWGYPWIIMTTVPIGISSGIVGLWLLNLFGAALPLFGITAIQQPFDMITMLGFLILVGTVVNNPILIVDQTMQNWHSGGMNIMDSVKEAVASRLRPILMTTFTTLVGLGPLVFIPGAGTELYRGVGAIVLFGLTFSTIVSLTYLPAVLIVLLKLTDRFKRPARANA